MFNEKILEHFRQPHNPGEVVNPSRVAEVTNPVCGDVLRLSVRLDGDVIAEARFKAQGCVPALAAASALTDMLVGKSLTVVKEISAAEISAALGGLPPASFHAAELCRAALAAL